MQHASIHLVERRLAVAMACQERTPLGPHDGSTQRYGHRQGGGGGPHATLTGGAWRHKRYCKQSSHSRYTRVGMYSSKFAGFACTDTKHRRDGQLLKQDMFACTGIMPYIHCCACGGRAHGRHAARKCHSTPGPNPAVFVHVYLETNIFMKCNVCANSRHRLCGHSTTST